VSAHRIVDSELVAPLTGQILYTCACNWQGRRWNEHAEVTGAAPLPPQPAPPKRSRRELHMAIYGNRHRCAKCRD
jgi:hypothetical protein